MSASLLQQVIGWNEKRRAAWAASLTLEHQLDLATVAEPWWFVGRPEQFAPPGTWRWWVICAGRGWGKTRTGAEWCAAKARRYPGARIALVAPTFADGRDTMVEGVSGLLAVLRPSDLRGGRVETAWNRSIGELFLANGSRFKIFTSEKPRQVRGPQFHFAWGDEPSYWNDVEQGTSKDSTWSNLNFALRNKARKGWDADYKPQGVLTMTPRRVPLLKVPEEVAAEKPYLAGLLQRPATGPAAVIVTNGKTTDNLDNLDESYRAAVVDPLIGTTLGRQELGGVMLEDVEGALWTEALLTLTRVQAAPALNRRCVAIDPAGGGGFGHDEHGIIVAGSAGTRRDPQLFVLADRSLNGSPTQACAAAIMAYFEFGCHALVVEKNMGQDWLRTTVESTFTAMTDGATHVVDGWEMPKLPAGTPMPRIELVPAVKNKYERATPVAMLYEQQRAHHVGLFPVLEGQMTTWVPTESDSPDRLDAAVWAISWLYGEGPSQADVASPAARERHGGRTRRSPADPSSRLPRTYGLRGR